MIAGSILAYSTASNQLSAARISRMASIIQILRGLLLIVAACTSCCTMAAGSPERTFELTIVRGAVPTPQRLLKVEKGDALKLRITSDAPGELHLHGYRLAAKLAPGEPTELAFNA